MEKETFLFTIDCLNNQSNNTEKVFKEWFDEELQNITIALENQYKIFNIGLNLRSLVNRYNFEEIVQIALLRNFFSFYSILDLTKKGLIGSARIIMRNIYEFLIEAKYIVITHDQKLFEKWNTDGDISLKRDVFSKVEKPNSVAMKQFWRELCGFSHASKRSQYLSLLYDTECYTNLHLNIIFMCILLEMNYHLLITYYLRGSLEYYINIAESARDDKENDTLKCLKLKQREVFNRLRKDYSPISKKIVYDYKLKWTFHKNT